MANHLNFPIALFERETATSPDWPDQPDVRRTVEWLRSFLSESEWIQRRDQAASRLFLAAQGDRPELGETGRYFDEKDTFAWYLFLAESYLDHPMNYEYIYGSRVLPIFERLGKSLAVLKQVPGVADRVERMASSGKGQPNGPLFELLVAAAYLDKGFSVSMTPELPGVRKTHDFDAEREGISYAVECKRMETGEYTERERSRMRELWTPYSEQFSQVLQSVQCEAEFAVSLDAVPNNYFGGIVDRWSYSSAPLRWKDSVGRGIIRRLDLRPLSNVLADDAVVSPSTRLLQLLTGEYIPAANYITSLRARAWDHPRYIAECDCAVVLRWESVSSEAVRKKARDGLPLIAHAIKQLPLDRLCVVHVGYEAVQGDDVEIARLERFRKAMDRFDPHQVKLEYVYSHCLVPESPPNKAWLFRETGSWQSVRPSRERPLSSPLLVLPSDEPVLDGGHWIYRGMWGDT